MGSSLMFIDQQNQYYENGYTTKSNLQIQLNPHQNSNVDAGGMAQVVEHLPIKYETLSSNPSTVKKKFNIIFHRSRKIDPRIHIEA
jgi:hypothetical protein